MAIQGIKISGLPEVTNALSGSLIPMVQDNSTVTAKVSSLVFNTCEIGTLTVRDDLNVCCNLDVRCNITAGGTIESTGDGTVGGNLTVCGQTTSCQLLKACNGIESTGGNIFGGDICQVGDFCNVGNICTSGNFLSGGQKIDELFFRCGRDNITSSNVQVANLSATGNILSGGQNLVDIFNTDTSITLQDVTDNGNTTTNTVCLNNTSNAICLDSSVLNLTAISINGNTRCAQIGFDSQTCVEEPGGDLVLRAGDGSGADDGFTGGDIIFKAGNGGNSCPPGQIIFCNANSVNLCETNLCRVNTILGGTNNIRFSQNCLKLGNDSTCITDTKLTFGNNDFNICFGSQAEDDVSGCDLTIKSQQGGSNDSSGGGAGGNLTLCAGLDGESGTVTGNVFICGDNTHIDSELTTTHSLSVASLSSFGNILSAGTNLLDIFNTTAIPSLQQVTSIGNTTTNSISTNNIIIANDMETTTISAINVTGQVPLIVDASNDILGTELLEEISTEDGVLIATDPLDLTDNIAEFKSNGTNKVTINKAGVLSAQDVFSTTALTSTFSAAGVEFTIVGGLIKSVRG